MISLLNNSHDIQLICENLVALVRLKLVLFIRCHTWWARGLWTVYLKSLVQTASQGKIWKLRYENDSFQWNFNLLTARMILSHPNKFSLQLLKSCQSKAFREKLNKTLLHFFESIHQHFSPRGTQGISEQAKWCPISKRLALPMTADRASRRLNFSQGLLPQILKINYLSSR